ncbi:XrtA/PEP-CTERM system TPR-repeat protein PrsT [Aquabacterium sp. OR-4]|uniref:XrtA/PEP-CTERM system TPR-repeat protein PrsT n=1 Tax=Aquabacterium sp. OR-4 TaxID=2978127 RepID=UPI0028CA33EC|nr:XrtA/PEP-CTERM system TPR-repeat protein PrsT [Aquabacterium sp. OR-4]MDT7837681.1 PEP-CTERM system TPR-repeat protein PrsT [Aquabacterium sp. OR-4]
MGEVVKSVARRKFAGPGRTKILCIVAVACTLAACSGEDKHAKAEQALQALKQGNPQLAMSILREELQAHPSDPATRLKLANILLDSGDPDGASIEFKKASEAGAATEATAPGLVRALVEKQQFALAIETYSDTKLQDKSSQAELTSWIALSQLRLGQKAKALALVENALNVHPGHPRASALAARIFASSGDLERAFKYLDVAATLPGASERPELWMTRADLLLYGKRNIGEAKAAYEKVVAHQPTNALAHSNLIQLTLLERDSAGASAALKAMSKALPKHPQTVFASAALAAHAKDFQRARDLLQALMRAGVSNVEVIALSGVVDLELGNIVSAVTQLQRAVYQSPQSAAHRKALARAQLKAGSPERALEALEPLLQGAVTDRDILSLAANAHLASGRTGKAEKLYVQALAIAPEDAGTKTQLALTKMRSDPEAALALLQSTADSSKDTVADMALISAQLQRRDFDGATKSIEKLRSKASDSLQPILLLGQVSMMKRDLVAARQQFESALTKDSKLLPALLALVSLDRIEGKYHQAETRLTEFLKKEPRAVGASMVLAELQQRRNAAPANVQKTLADAVAGSPADATARKALMAHHLRRNETKAFLEAAQAANAALPADLGVLSMLGNAQMMSGDVNQALATFQKLITQAPSNPKGHVQLAQAEAVAGRASKAEASFRKALELDPDSLEANRGLVSLGMKEKRPELAIKAAKSVQKDRPDDGLGHILEGDILLRLGKNDAALSAYRGGLDRKHPLALPSRIFALLKLTKSDKIAQGFADEWLQKHPQDANFRFFLGTVALQGEQWPLAEKYFSDVNRLAPNSPSALNNLAWLRVKLNKTGAVALAEQALKQSPDAAALLDTLALAQASEGQLGKAVESARLAISTAPDVAGYHVTLAQVLLKAGKRAEAEAALSDAEKLKPNPEVARTIADFRRRAN